MNIYEQLEANWEAGYYSVVQDDFGYFCIFSTKNENNTLRYSGWYTSFEQARTNIGQYKEYEGDLLLKNAKENKWKIIDTIHPSELMCSGLKPKQKVRIKDNAKEECLKSGLGWNEHMAKMVGIICEVKGKLGSDYRVYNGNKTNHWNFPPSALTPVYEEEITIEHILETLPENHKEVLRKHLK